MIKCEVIEYFTLKKFSELENIVRAKSNVEDIGGTVLGNVLNNSTRK